MMTVCHNNDDIFFFSNYRTIWNFAGEFSKFILTPLETQGKGERVKGMHTF